MRALVVGCGFLGEAVADRLHATGWDVTGWTHSPESAAALAARKPYPVRAQDVSRKDEVMRVATDEFECGTDTVVIQCTSSGRGGGVEAYRRVYLQGAIHLLTFFGLGHLIFVGSTSVYAQTDGAWVNEDSPAAPERETSRILRDAEGLPFAFGQTVTRLAGLYGPGRSVLLRKFLAAEAVIEGDGGRWLNQIHRDDAADALVRLAQPDAPRGLFNVVDDTPLTQRALYEGLAARLGRPLPPSGEPDLNRKRGWTSKRVSNARLKAATGWAPRFPSFFDALDGLGE